LRSKRTRITDKDRANCFLMGASPNPIVIGGLPNEPGNGTGNQNEGLMWIDNLHDELVSQKPIGVSL
jgi:hypothetical protein